MSTPELLRLAGVTRTVVLPDETDLHILTGVDLAVHEGDHIGIIGRSGTGKSTLLNILGLLDRPTSGAATSGSSSSSSTCCPAARPWRTSPHP